MSTKLNHAAYADLVAEDITWLDKQPQAIERDHIRQVLRASVDGLYDGAVALDAGSDRGTGEARVDAGQDRAAQAADAAAKEALAATGEQSATHGKSTTMGADNV